MEFIPVIEIVQVHCVSECAIAVTKSARAKDAFARSIVVNVAFDGRVQFINARLIEFDAGLLFDPRLKLRVSRLVIFDVVDDGIAIQSKAVDDHLIVAFARAGITCGEFAARFE